MVSQFLGPAYVVLRFPGHFEDSYSFVSNLLSIFNPQRANGLLNTAKDVLNWQYRGRDGEVQTLH